MQKQAAEGALKCHRHTGPDSWGQAGATQAASRRQRSLKGDAGGRFRCVFFFFLQADLLAVTEAP